MRKSCHPIFKGRNLPSNDLLRSLRVSGGSTAIANKLCNEINYDRIKTLGMGIITTDQDGVIKSTNWLLLGSLQTIVTPAKNIWNDAHKDLSIVLRIKDLSIFEFRPCKNISAWIERESLDIRIVNKITKKALDWEASKEQGVGDVTARAIIVPGSPTEALL